MSQSDAMIDTRLHAVDDQSNQQASQALELLRHEARVHQAQISETGLLGRAFAGASEFWHHSNQTGTQVDRLGHEIEADLATGKSSDAATLAGGAKILIKADQQALKSRAEIAQYGSGAVQTVGLFMAGRKGFVIAGVAAALDAFKPGSKDSVGEQIADVGLGVTRALALKGAYALAGKFNLGMATTAVGLGIDSRFSDLAFNRKTYLDSQTGSYSANLGVGRIWAGTTEKGALASDIITLAVARGALGKLNIATDGALTANKLWSTMAVGGVFGISQGSVSELVRQGREGTFAPGQFALHTLIAGATGMAGAAIGGAGGARAMGTAMAEAEKSALLARPLSEVATAAEAVSPKTLTRPNIADAKANFPGSTSREFQITGGNFNVAQTLAKSAGAFAFTRVREIQPGGALGPEQNLLVQHGGDGIAVKTALAAKADIVATCNPETLPIGVRQKHIMPSVQRTLWLSEKPGGKISFSDRLAAVLKPGEGQAVALGNRSVSDILRDPSTLDKLNNKGVHDLGLYSDVLKDFKIPAKRVIIGGADSVVLELADESILKITPHQWNPEWGQRTYRDAQGMLHRFDAKIIGKPTTVDRPDGTATYYIQERAKTPVSESTRDIFAHTLDRDGKYSFWDRDEAQLGTVDIGNGKRGLVLLDYDAVRPLHLVPRDMKTPHEDRFDREDRFSRW